MNRIRNITVELARVEDFPAILALLEENGLPREGLEAHLASTLVARTGDTIIGSVAVEPYGEGGLLRSVAVAGAWRGQGVGHLLTQAALSLARQQGITQLYLLTEGADDFFARFGFQLVSRTEVLPAVLQSIEFTTICPESAHVMAMALPCPAGV